MSSACVGSALLPLLGWTDEGYEVGVLVHRTQELSDVTLVGADVVATMDTVARYIAGLASAPKR